MRKRWLALLLAGILSAAPAAYTFADALSMEDGSEVAGALSYYLYDGEEVAEEDASPEESEEGSGRLKVIAKYFGKAKDEIVPLLSELGVITEEDISEAAADTYDDGSEGDSRFADKVSEFASEFRDDVTPFVSWLADELKYSRNTAYEFSDWNEGAPAVSLLKEYVADVTDPDSENFIPQEARVAVFDLDGTLYSETHPICAAWKAFTDRALNDPKYADDTEMQAAVQGILQAAAGESVQTDIFEKIPEQEMKAFSGMTIPEYNEYVTEFLQKDAWGFEGLMYGEAFFRPMVEVVEYLKDCNFKIYVITGSDRMLARELIRDFLPIEPENVIGMDCVLVSREEYEEAASKETATEETASKETATEKTSSEGTATEETADVTSAGSSELVRSETLSEGNTRLDKVSMIAREIGRQPVLCFGNSLIDESMAAYTVNSNPYRSEVFMVVADDDERDWADPEKAAELREKWEGLGWNIISMKDDFRNIYGDEAVRDKERPEIEGLIIEEEPVYTEYVVQANDNLWKIAAKAYGSGREYTKIAEANNLEAPYEVTAGQVLMIPEAVPAA